MILDLPQRQHFDLKLVFCHLRYFLRQREYQDFQCLVSPVYSFRAVAGALINAHPSNYLSGFFVVVHFTVISLLMLFSDLNLVPIS